MYRYLKRMTGLSLTIILILILAFTSLAATGTWKHNSKGWWYQYSTGGYPYGEWESIGGKWYHFDENGYMQTGWIKDSGEWYYLGSNGAMVTGWQKISGKWYYFDKSGAMQTRWLRYSGKWYYLGANGAMRTGWQKISNKWYAFDASGVMQTGWLKSSGKWYYLGANGAMRTGWQKISSKWYYFDASGVMQTGWLKDSGNWYYLKSNGVMVTGTVVINGKTYKFDENGVWQSESTSGWKSAYAKLVRQYESQYGTGDVTTFESMPSDSYPRANGVYYLELLDMDLNGSQELLIGYSTKEFYGWNLDIYEYRNGTARLIQTIDDAAFYQGVDIAYYCLHYYNGEVCVCKGGGMGSQFRAKLYGYQGSTFGLLASYSPSEMADGDHYGNIDFGYGTPDTIVTYTVYGLYNSDLTVLKNQYRSVKTTLGFY